MNLKVYHYAKCGTCRKAAQFLKNRGIDAEWIPVREKPPSLADLRRMLAVYQGDIRRLFNTSGGDYREMNLKESLPTMKEDDALKLLATHGNLVKRPFALTATSGCVGFREEEWERLLAG